MQSYPFCMNKDPSEYFVDKVTQYIKKHVSKDKVKWKIQQSTRTNPSKLQKEKNMAMK